MDKNNFDDNNNKRYKGDDNHRYQDSNIIYKSLEQDPINLILVDAHINHLLLFLPLYFIVNLFLRSLRAFD